MRLPLFPAHLACFALLAFAPVSAAAALSSYDKVAMGHAVQEIAQAVNEGDPARIRAVLSPGASPSLIREIEEFVSGKPLEFHEDVSSFEEQPDGRVIVSGSFAARTASWNISGLSNSFTFEKVDDEWLLSETDFHLKLNAREIVKFIGKIMAIVIPVIGLAAAFWIWMLADALRKPLPNKTLWVLIIALLGIVGALLYFFIERRKFMEAVIPKSSPGIA